ncbi:MAG: SpaH/EbpB family LPXTG-anchored major pilin [Corynebacterium sp.]|uniref:SpaH/EbpB family LPXTG-anchored major pilin n=1 Tax=Corynebacterium sp. TaxID=1720 RepID=UPI0026DD83FD|nr:SpaH/EbpB family LPXTG-anchored major pilin [Corynebacterium sp.]MDO4761475.1 SpaH/EbpB family LPXTG-anchored major pilin [Corynebacterium sp.]
MNIFKKALVASVAAGMLAAGPAGIMAANATVNLNPVTAESIAQLVKDKAPTRLTIHKHEGPDGAEHNGTELADLPDPIRGAQFTIRKAPTIAPEHEQHKAYDLTTNKGWENAQRLQRDLQVGGTKLSKAAMDEGRSWSQEGNAVETDQSGKAIFPNLEPGLYFVEETLTPQGYNKSVPFMIALPMTHPTELNERLKDVHVYPKNYKRGAAVKTVEDANKNAGDIIDYSITMPRPVGNVLKKFVVGDLYDPQRLEFKGLELTDRVKVTINGQPVPTTGYTVQNQKQTGLATVTLNEQGLNQFTAADMGHEIVVTLPFELLPVEGGELGPVENKFDIRSQADEEFDPGEPDGDDNPDNPPYRPEDPTKSYFGNVTFVKSDFDQAPIQGAQFNVYRCDSKTDLKGSPIQLILPDGRTKTDVFESNNQGVVELRGLHVNNVVDGQATPSTPAKYCLVEIKSPAGKALLAEPIEFQVTKGDNDKVALVDLATVVNVDQNGGFRLPLTGGTGIYLLLAAGGAFLLIGGGYYLKLQRRRG